MTETGSARSVAFALWCGHLGGAERHTIEIAALLKEEHGLDVGVLYIEDAGRSGAVLDRLGIPYAELGMERGSQVLWHPRKFADALAAAGSDIAFLPRGGYVARAARIGGYDGALVSVEHGGILQVERSSWSTRAKESFGRLIGESSLDGTVCVSKFVCSVIREYRHSKRIEVIYNGVDTSAFRPGDKPVTEVVFGHAGRLIEGKGIMQLVGAFDPDCVEGGARLLIAGDGPARADAERMVAERGIGHAVDFLGVIDDMPAFWHRCSVGAHVTHSGWRESFCLSVVEAMACGLPVIVSDEGALPEIVEDGVLGCVVESPNVPLLNKTLFTYAQDPARRVREGQNGRQRAVEKFDIHRAGAHYRAFADELVSARRSRRETAH